MSTEDKPDKKEDDLVQLKQENKWLKELINTLPQTVFETDLKANFTFLNKSAYQLFGYEENDKSITSPLQILHKDYIEIGIKNITILLKGQKSEDTEYLVYRKDKTTFPALIQSVPIYEDNKIVGLRGFVIDLSEHKKFEGEIEESKAHLLSIINSLDTSIITVDSNLHITRWNNAILQLFKLQDIDYRGYDIDDVIPILKPYIKELKSTIKINKISNEIRVKLDKPYRTIYNITFFPLDGMLDKGAVIRIDDITESVNKNELLIQAQKMETIGTLTGGIAHDFNNVLGGIVGTISLLKLKYKTADDFEPSEWQKYLSFMQESSKRAVDMVQQLLTLSKKREINPLPLDLNHSLKMVMKICETSFDKSIQLKAHYSEEQMMVFADPTQIEQVILNLCINGYHAMTIMRENKEIFGELNISFSKITADKLFLVMHPEAIEMQEYCIISVTDNGVGIDDRVKEKIFDPFFTTKDKNLGTGLGLAMVYNIIHQHNGFLTFYSERNNGSTFNVYLPSFRKINTDILESQSSCIFKGQGTILIADDEPIIRELAKSFLTECGYHVLTAKNGEECIELYKEFEKEISAVLLDMVMPIKSGYITFLELKAYNPNTKVIITSGFKNDERILELMKIGASGFIQKPYTVEALSKELNRIL